MKKLLKKIFHTFGFDIIRASREGILHKPEKYVGTDYKTLPITILRDEENSTFFGYHDKTPFSKSGTKVLACSVSQNNSNSSDFGEKMKLGVFEKGADGIFQPSFQKFAETETWCWQQGCMLQWNPIQPENEVFFNTKVNGRLGAYLYDIDKKEKLREFSQPFYAIDPTGRYAASLNFIRLGVLRPGYGYDDSKNTEIINSAPKDDGIYLINLKTGKSELIINLKELAEYTNKNVYHYINHITFSPSGRYITFFHIYQNKFNHRLVRFYLYDLKSQTLKLLEANNRVSHYCWRSDEQLLTTELEKNGKVGYYLYNFIDKNKVEIELMNIGDFHPMFNPLQSDIIVADTIPDRNRNQHLFIMDINKIRQKHVGTFYTPEKFSGPFRCDLHPRWDRNGTCIVVDTTQDGLRAMALIDVSGCNVL